MLLSKCQKTTWSCWQSWPSHWPVSLKLGQKVANCILLHMDTLVLFPKTIMTLLSWFSLQICPFGLSHVHSGESRMLPLPSPRFLKAPLISVCQSRSWALVRSLAHMQWCGPPELQHPVLISCLMEALAFPGAAWKGKLWWNQKMGSNQMKNSSSVFQRTVSRYSTNTP